MKIAGVHLRSVLENIDGSPESILLESLLEGLNEYYSQNLAREVQKGKKENALQAKYVGGVPPLGYLVDPQTKKLEKDPFESQAVELIFRMYIEGAGYTKIINTLNQKGYRTKRGNLFDRRAVYRILTNRFYVGTVSWNNIEFQGSHETRPSVTDLFDDNQKRIRREYRPQKIRDTSSCAHWASGLLRCSICGSSMAYNRSNNPKKRSDIFQCWKYAKGFHSGSCSVSVKKVEIAVLKSMEEILETGSVTYEYEPVQDPITIREEDLIQDALARLDVKERRIRDAYENEIDTLEEYRQNKARLQQERDELNRQAAALAAASVPEKPDDSVMLSAIQKAYSILSDPTVDYEKKGVAARSVIKSIVYNRAESTFKFTYFLNQ